MVAFFGMAVAAVADADEVKETTCVVGLTCHPR